MLPPPGPGQEPIPSGPTSIVTESTSLFARRVAKLPVGAWIGVALVAVAGIVGGFVVTGDDEVPPTLAIDTEDLAPATTRSPAPTSPEPSRPAPSAPGTEPVDTRPVELGDGRRPGSPMPLGEPFTYDEYGDTWVGTVLGLVEGELWDGSDSGLTCWVALATIRPTEAGGLIADSYSSPSIEVWVDGEMAEPADAGGCDIEELERAGWVSLLAGEVTPGTEVGVYSVVTLESDVTPQAIAVGFDDYVFYDATPLTAIPDLPRGEVGELAVDLLPLPAGEPATYTYTGYAGDAWELVIDGLIDLGTDAAAGGPPGRCLALVGTASPTDIVDGVVADAFTAPRIGLVASGRFLDGRHACGADAVEGAGYVWYGEAEVTAGTRLPVYTTILIPPHLDPEPTALVVGDPWATSEVGVYEPTVLDELPTPASLVLVPAGVTTSPIGQPVTIIDPFDDTEWTITVLGLVPGELSYPEQSPSGTTCVTVLAEVRPGDGGVAALAPYPSLIRGGRLVRDGYECDTAAVEDAGFVDWYQIDPEAGATAYAYAQFVLRPGLGDIEAVQLGRPIAADAPGFVAATLIDSVPARPR